ncbi:MAG: 4-(cytidine 5'-diphospho)-2-C-methyl-D-erythritol kinase, partial [Acinetobacter sp.]|nr:4-(cytidine 5'-diphospho)-2-C-methyl-D-erythritol kinase [Acinetobacter sp.]
LWQCQCSNEQLQHLALNLGADVPFFILGKNAWVEGIGEHLTAIDLPEKHYFVIKPDCFISTQHLFSQKSLTRDTKITKFSDYQIQPNLFRNNFEAVAIELYPEVKRAIDHLNQIGQARLTGTGSCIFVEIDDKIDYSDFLKQSPYPIYKVKSLAQSPLVDFKLDD